MRLLFRPEAMRAQSEQALGRVRLVQPPSLAWLATGAALIAALLLALLFAVPQVRTARAEGVLVTSRAAEVLVPASRVAVLSSGQTAALHFEALPSRAGGQAVATVERVARTPDADGRYAVALRVDAVAVPVEPGMRLAAVITLERRPLAQALFAR
jgi:hypothetical protein